MFGKKLKSTKYLKAKFAILFFLCRIGNIKKYIPNSMDRTGENWDANSHPKDCIIFFGIPFKARNKIVNALPQYRCAFAFKNTPWFLQCAFFQLYKTNAVFILNQGEREKPISHSTYTFLNQIDIPVFTYSTELEMELDIANMHINLFHKYYPVVLYGKNWENETQTNDIVLCCCPSYRNIGRYTRVAPEKKWAFFSSKKSELEQLETFLDDFYVGQVISLGKATFSNKLKELLATRALTIETVPNHEAASLLLNSCSDSAEIDTKKPVAILLNDQCTARYANQFDQYNLFHLPPGLELNDLELLKNYTLIWGGNELANAVRKYSRDTTAPVIQLAENMLSLFGYRKNFPTPLFEEQFHILSEYSLGCRYTFMADSPELDDSGLLSRAAAFRDRLLTLHRSLIDKDDDNSKDRPMVPEKNFVLAIWEGNKQSEKQCSEFLENVTKQAKGKKIFCLAITNGNAVTLHSSLNILLKNQCFFLKHVKDIDFLLPHADAVHVYKANIGFEALLRGKCVVTYGKPWYAGWGVTIDREPVERSRSLTLDQLTALVFFHRVTYAAPYSGEKLNPEEALALWYMRQRPDFSRIFEGLQNNLGTDPRFLILDLRSNFYDLHEIDEKIADLLQASVFGSVLADLLMFRFESKKFRNLLEILPHDKAIDAFNILNLQAYYFTNYELINFYIKEISLWFSEQYMEEKNILKFYSIYFDATIRNRFYDSIIPEFLNFKYSNKTIEEKVYFEYAKILLFSFSYDKFTAFLCQSPDFSSAYYFDLIKTLYANSRDLIKETDIRKRVLLRCKIFQKYLAIRKNEGKADFPRKFNHFMICCLVEKRFLMDLLSEELAPLCKDKNFLSEDAKELLYMVTDMLVSNHEIHFAQVILNRLVPKNISIPSKRASLRNNIDVPSKRITYNNRVIKILETCEKTKQNIMNTGIYHHRLVRSNNYSLLRHYQKTANIVLKAKPPKENKGTIFFGYYGSFFSATLPVVLHRLVEKGYSVYPIFNNHIALPVPRSPFEKFAYALPDNNGPLRLQWTIDFSRQCISALGINLYERFFESIATLIRSHDFDWEMPNVQRIFRSNLKQTDSALYWCDQLYKTAYRSPCAPKIGILSLFPYQLPEAAFFDYVMFRGNENFRYIQFKNKAHFDLVHRGNTKPTGISAFDMGLYPDCRLSFLPARSRFEPWFAANKSDPAFQQQIEDVRQDLRERTSYGEGDILDYLKQEKAAGKRIVCCIGRLLFDQALRKDGGPGHANIRDWLKHSVEVAAETPDLILIIRPHPHEENPIAAVRARQTLRDILPANLPPNVIYSQPGDMNIQALVGLIDLAVLWLGTAAYELTALGTPVAICSHAGHDQSPFNAIFPESRTDYVNLLKAKTYPTPDVESQKKGAACLHYIASSGVIKDYPYAYVRLSNSFRIIPYYHTELLEQYFSQGDPNIEAIVDNIVEGLQS